MDFRVSQLILAIGIVSIQHRNILILHGGDSVVRLGAQDGARLSWKSLLRIGSSRVMEGKVKPDLASWYRCITAADRL